MSDTPGDAKPTCFMAMPISMSPEHTTKYGDPKHWLHVMEELFEPAIRAAGFEPVRPVSTGAYLIHSQIVTNLEKADLVLCDLSAHNPNVFFELGVRTSLNLPIALVGEQDIRLPFDTSGINTHMYSSALHAWDLSSEIEGLTAHLKESAESCAGKNPLWQQFGLTKRATEPTVSQTREEAQLDVVLQRVDQLASIVQAQVHRSSHRDSIRSNTKYMDALSQSEASAEVEELVGLLGGLVQGDSIDGYHILLPEPHSIEAIELTDMLPRLLQIASPRPHTISYDTPEELERSKRTETLRAKERDFARIREERPVSGKTLSGKPPSPRTHRP